MVSLDRYASDADVADHVLQACRSFERRVKDADPQTDRAVEDAIDGMGSTTIMLQDHAVVSVDALDELLRAVRNAKAPGIVFTRYGEFIGRVSAQRLTSVMAVMRKKCATVDVGSFQTYAGTRPCLRFGWNNGKGRLAVVLEDQRDSKERDVCVSLQTRAANAA